MIKKIIFCAFLFSLLMAVSIKYKPTRMFLSETDYSFLNGYAFKLLGKNYGGLESDKYLYNKKIKQADYSWLSNDISWIAHKLGGVGERSNSIHAFYSSLNSGFRFFEVDIVLVDKQLLCVHSFEELKPEQPCTLEVLITLAESHDIWFILDVKSEFNSAYKVITQTLKQTSVGRKFIPQIYQFKQLERLDLELFSGPLFTGYRRNQHGDFLKSVAIDLKLPVLTLPPNKINLNSKVIEPNIQVFSHNIRSVEDYKKLKGVGVTGFYLSEAQYLKIKIK